MQNCESKFFHANKITYNEMFQLAGIYYHIYQPFRSGRIWH